VMGFGFFGCQQGGDGGSSLGVRKLIPGMPLHGHACAEAREQREVADLEEDEAAIGFGKETVRSGGGGR
jgi:hypothetical protein